MEAPKTLRRPSNWQDFETLCKKLWGEIWNCQEIKKNGRNGQIQHGVDVYGVPQEEVNYYGIQCKGKNAYNQKTFTESELLEEIEKAKFFKPELKKLYFATTAPKDSKIEEVVRLIDLKHRKLGIFEVHIFSWEDIVDLIDENRQTHDWYLNSQKYKDSKKVVVLFENNKEEIIIRPVYRNRKNIYRPKELKEKIENSNAAKIAANASKISTLSFNGIPKISFSSTKRNLTYCRIAFKLINLGLSPIENFKLYFRLEGDIDDIKENNEIDGILMPHLITSDLNLNTDLWEGEIIPKTSILVSDETYLCSPFYLKPIWEAVEVKVNWKLISKDYKLLGTMMLSVNPDIRNEYKVVYVDEIDIPIEKENGKIEDFIEKKM